MANFDFIQELRTGTPDIDKAARTLRQIGWGCVVAGGWNLLVPMVFGFEDAGIPFSMMHAYGAAAVLLPLGLLFLAASRGVAAREPRGKRLGQTAVVLLLVALCLMPLLLLPMFDELGGGATGLPRRILLLFGAIIVAQSMISAYFGLRYLQRLPMDAAPDGLTAYDEDAIGLELAERFAVPGSGAKFKDALLPVGLHGTFVLEIMVLFAFIFLAQSVWGENAVGWAFFVVFPVVFLAPMLYNFLTSPFEEGRQRIAAFTGGGSIAFFSGSWPFFRILIYTDAVEVRVMLHRFLIPYEHMKPIKKPGFFSLGGIVITSDLPGVPAKIRFHGRRKTLAVLKGAYHTATASQAEGGNESGRAAS